MLEIKNLTIVRGNTPIIQNLNFSVNRGECVIIEGKNGSGKSTLLACLMGALRPTHGQVLIDQHDLSTLNRDQKRKFLNSTGIFREESSLPSHDTVMYGERAHVLIQDLSTRERKKLTLDRILKNHPSLLLLDEPLLGFDTQQTSEIQQTLKELKSAQVTIIIFTTDRSAYHFLNSEKILGLEMR